MMNESRLVPGVDAVAQEYLLIGLSLGEIEEGIVDAYYGPPELLEQARAERAAPIDLVARAAELRARLDEVDDAQRAEWLDRQLIALSTLARQAAGEQIAYRDVVEQCFDAAPEPTPPEEYARVRADLDELLPGTGDLRDRLAARDETLSVAADNLPAIVEWLTTELRGAARGVFNVPEGEDLTVTLVKDEPWGAYNWYRGNLQSLIEINTDLPVRATALVGLLAHEAFPGHHLEHVSKEAHLVRDLGRFESSLQLINTPEAYISEGLAELGVRFVAPANRWQQLLIGICERAGLAITPAEAERHWLINSAVHRLRGSQGDAALLMHVRGRSTDDVIAFLEQDALYTRDRALKSLEFLTHPLWRAYVFCYAGGEALLASWVEQAEDEAGERERFSRLLTEQLTPSAVAVETAQGS